MCPRDHVSTTRRPSRISNEQIKQKSQEQRIDKIDRLISGEQSSPPRADSDTEKMLVAALMKVAGYAGMWEFARNREECEEIILKCMDTAKEALAKCGEE